MLHDRSGEFNHSNGSHLPVESITRSARWPPPIPWPSSNPSTVPPAPKNSLWEVQPSSVPSSQIIAGSKFWLEDFSVLFRSLQICPNRDMSNADRLNALTRIIILIAAILYCFKFPGWGIFLAVGFFVIIIIWAIIRAYEEQALRLKQTAIPMASNKNRPILCRRRRSILTPLGFPIDPRCGEIVNTQILNLKPGR